MKKIKLNKGYTTLVDDEDYDFLTACGSWFVTKNGYAVHSFKFNGVVVQEYMHRIILQPKKGYQTDHINGDKLDNRKCNLRYATNIQNSWNKISGDKKRSLPRGVYKHTQNHNWVAQIQIPFGKRIHLGSFKTKSEAAYTYNQFAEQLFGEFARLNTL